MPARRKLSPAYIQKIVRNRHLKDLTFIAVGILSASIGLKGFLLPNNFLDGGATGVSLLVEIVTGLDLSILLILVNIPFLWIGANQLSKAFAFKSSLAILSIAVVIHLLTIPVVTTDKLLIAFFGGFFLGGGIGLAIRGGAVIDGTEVLAVAVSRKSTLTVGDFILLFNIVLFMVAAVLVNIETAMYSLLTYLSASKTADFIINGIEEYMGVTIVSREFEAIQAQITHQLGRGVTVYKAESGFTPASQTPEDRKVLFCVVTRLEVTRLLLEVEKLDPEAFVVQHPIQDTKGGMIKKRPLHT